MAIQTRNGEPELPATEEREGCMNANLPEDFVCRDAGMYNAHTSS